MPALRQEKPQTGFTRVNLRTARTATQPTDAAKAINVDFNREIGTALIRYGQTLLHTISDLTVRLIAKVIPYRYYVGGQNLYRDGVNLNIHPSILDPGLTTDIEGMRPINDSNVWAFIADPGVDGMLKDNGTVTRKWGIDPPPATMLLAQGNTSATTGIAPAPNTTANTTYGYYIDYIRFDTNRLDSPVSVAHEGNPDEIPLVINSSAIVV